MILLDTDICIELLRGNRNVIFKRKQVQDDISISFMTLGELYYGVSKSSNPEKNHSLLELFLLSVKIINSDNRIMGKFGELKSNLSKRKLILPDADILIAATCYSHCDLLITGNTKHFNRFEGLNLNNWIN